MHVHLIGIGGSGMSAIARLLLERGDRVSGSDCRLSTLALRLKEDGARVYEGHHAEHVHGADLVVRSSAIPDDNVEITEALKQAIPVLKRADFLGQLMGDRMGIAVAGTHGKTTTTAMVVWLLTALNQDPSFIVGGVLNNLATNARAGRGPSFVIEADEYDHMFLGLSPSLAVVTNVEHDHPDQFPTKQAFHRAFQQFVGRIRREGTLLACTDDPGAARLLREARPDVHRTLSYGLQGSPDYQGRNMRAASGGGVVFDFTAGERVFARAILRLPGRHNVQNAVAALAVIDLLGLSVHEAAVALEDFRGTGRRFQVRGEAAGVVVVDDYAHHPTEIRATLEAAKSQFPEHSLWAVWQPHTFFRTMAFFDQFVAAFSQADHVLVTDVFAAREEIPEDFSSQQVVAAIDHPDARYCGDFNQTVRQLLEGLGRRDVVLVLSAGDAEQVSVRLLASLFGRESRESEHG